MPQHENMSDRRVLTPIIGKKAVVDLDPHAPDALNQHMRKGDAYLVVDVGERQLFIQGAHNSLVGIPLNCIVKVTWNVEQSAEGPFDQRSDHD